MTDTRIDMRKTVNHELQELAAKVAAKQSFSHNTLEDAKERADTHNYYYCFDACSLCFYDHNMSESEYSIFGDFISDYLSLNKEAKKQRIERASLFVYLHDKNHPWHGYRIEKRERPDFCLTGDDGVQIGIEVVGFTPEYTSVLEKIVDENYGKGKTAEQIKKDARKNHGDKVDRYVYYDHKGVRAVGTNTQDVNCLKQQYASMMHQKYEKYKSSIADFNRFVILGDAQRRASMGIDHECDADEVYNLLEVMEPAIRELTVVIIWYDADDNHIHVKEYQ